VSSAAWRGNGFYYSRYPQPEKGRELSSANEDHRVYYHRIGTPQSEDELVYSDPKNPQRFHTVSTTEDERFLVLNISDRGTGKQGNAVMVMDLSKPGATFTPLIPDITDDSYNVLENIRGELLVYTDNNAPNGRVVRINPANPAPSNWVDVIAPKTEPIDGVGVAGGKIFVTYMKDVASKAYVHNLEGTLENEIALPGLGSVSGFGGNMDDKFVFYNYTSFTYPTTIFRYDISSRRSSTFRAPEVPGLDPAVFETTQVFVTSKDGTKVPMFLTHKKGLALDGNNPTLMYGYGGFNIATTPSFNALRIALLEQGFVYASRTCAAAASTARRGTTRQGEEAERLRRLHRGGRVAHRQQYTSPARSAQGGSNGGLLVGAVINQRPELFGSRSRRSA
jgi:prolyl oligopeptidase